MVLLKLFVEIWNYCIIIKLDVYYLNNICYIKKFKFNYF